MVPRRGAAGKRSVNEIRPSPGPRGERERAAFAFVAFASRLPFQRSLQGAADNAERATMAALGRTASAPRGSSVGTAARDQRAGQRR